jgi:hypothetical protein
MVTIASVDSVPGLLRIVALLCSCGGVAALVVPASRAAGQFGSRGSASGQFIEPAGAAVAQASGDVYLVDSNNHRVEKFTSNGGFLYAWGWGVADGRSPAPQVFTTKCHAGLYGTGAVQMGFVEGVAVDNDPSSPSYRAVYVMDLGSSRVEKFGPFGGFLLMFGGGVNETAHKRGETDREDVCPVRPRDRCGPGRKGTRHGQFWFRAEGDLVAVGPAGTVYVGDLNRVQEFSPSGLYESQVRLPAPEATGVEAGAASGLAVNSIGDLYVIENGVGGVKEYTPAGGLLRTLDYQGASEGLEGPTPTIALDASGDLFIDEHPPLHGEYAPKPHLIVEYGPEGIPLASFDADMGDGLHGLAYGDRAGRLYVVNADNDVSPVVARVRIVAPSPSHQAFAFAWCGWAGADPSR